MDELAKKYAVTPTGIAIAWITRHPANLQVVLGTTKPSRVRESVAGSDVDADARGVVPPVPRRRTHAAVRLTRP